MRYRNIKIQAVMETACVISGGDWVVEDTKTATQPKRKAVEKKGGEERK